MKKLIQEATRLKQLANIKEAIPSSTSFTDLSQERPGLKFKPGGPIIPPDNFINTADEKAVDQALKINTTLKQKLAKINNVAELDGLFRIILDATSLDDISKSNIVAALNKSLKSLAPNSTTINTVDKKP